MKGYQPVPDFPMYKINENGEVWRLYKAAKPRKRNWSYNGGGYAYVHLSDSPRLKAEFVQRLVWKTFRGEIPQGMEVHHKNYIKDDNRLENLELVTQTQNLYYRWNKQ